MKKNSFVAALIVLTSMSSASAGNLLPDPIYQKVIGIAATDANASQRLHKIQELICSGKHPKFAIKYSVNYVSPKTPSMGLDQAAKKKRDYLEAARYYFRNELLFESGGDIATFGYEINGEKEIYEELRRLYTPRAEDMGTLINGFTFKLPLDTIESDIHYFGYDTYTHDFSASKAVDNREYIWKYVLKNSTRIMEAPKQDGSIKCTIELSMDTFCQYAIPVTDLISN